MRLFFPLSGDDIFISYSRKDGALYAAGLADKLTEKKLSCFIDKLGVKPDHDLPSDLRKKIKSCSVFVLIGTEKAALSEFVQKEIAEFKQTGRTILPIDFDGNVGSAIWYEEIPGLAVETEKDPAALETGNPSQNVVSFVEKSFNYTRRNQFMSRMFWGALTLVLVLAGIGVGASYYAIDRINFATLQQKKADEAAEKTTTATRLAREQEEQARLAKAEADRQKEIVQEEKEKADKATVVAGEKTELAKEKTELAAEKTQLADMETTKAKNATKEAERQQAIANNLAQLNKIEGSERLLNLAETKVADDPAQSIRLAEAALSLNPNANARDTIIGSVRANPVWNRLPPAVEPIDTGDLFPDTFGRDKRPFVVDQNIQFALIAAPNEPHTLALYNVDTNEIESKLELEQGEELIEEEPYARDIIGLVSRDSKLRIFKLNPEGLKTPIVSVNNVVSFSCANGSFPCAIGKNNGEVFLYNLDADKTVTTKKIGTWSEIEQLTVHPSGKSLVVITKNGDAFWVSNYPDRLSQKSIQLNLQGGQWYLYRPRLPWIKWGPEPNNILALEPSWASSGKPISDSDDDNHVIVMSAIDPLSNKKQILLRTKHIDNGLRRPVFQTDLPGKRVLWVVQGPKGGTMVVEALTIEWKNNDAEIVSLVKKKTGLLYGEVPAQSSVNLQTAILSPDGNYAIISNDIRGTSGTQSGHGLLESWNINSLDEQGSEKPEASKLPILEKKHVLKIAYSQDQGRIAVLDMAGIVSIFKVRKTPPSFWNNNRIPETILDRFMPDIRSSGNSGRYWVVRYDEADHRIYDLSDGSMVQLEGLLPNQKILAVSMNENLTTVVTDSQIVRLDGKKIVTGLDAIEKGNLAGINETLITLTKHNLVYLYEKSSLKLIGWINLDTNPELRDMLPESEIEAYKFSNSAFHLEYSTQEKKIRGFHINSQNEIAAWETDRPSIPSALIFRKGWSLEIPTKTWYSMRRLIESNILLFLSGDYGQRTVLWQLDGSTGQSTAIYSMPSLELSSLFEIVDFSQMRNDKVAIVFRTTTGMLLGTWNKNGGPPVTWNELKLSNLERNSFLGMSEVQGSDLAHITVNVDKLVNVYSLTTGQLIWKDKLENVKDVPYLKNDGKMWKIVNDTAFLKVRNEVSLGGGVGIFDDLTKIRLNSQKNSSKMKASH